MSAIVTPSWMINGNNDEETLTVISSDPPCKYGNGTLKHCLL